MFFYQIILPILQISLTVVHGFSFTEYATLVSAVYHWPSDVDTYGHISSWDVSAITDMHDLFAWKLHFNEDLSHWNTSSVTSMEAMFAGCSDFNRNLSPWNIAAVTNMAWMFYQASSFNQTLCWDNTHVGKKNNMFDLAGGGKIAESYTACIYEHQQPTLSPTPLHNQTTSCDDDPHSFFLKSIRMEENQYVPVLRKCDWLRRQKRTTRAMICERNTFGNFVVAKDLCPFTCKTCAKME